ncbi:MAG: hypothetical protein HC771_09985 [Synechococcales cyanobacterium CRU_2_2]|nr:hypothetical protein [Synechococcales cyanobacterium CRU_2_2]
MQDGRNTVRVLSDVITGYLYWSDDNKPQRSRERPEGVPDRIRLNDDGKPDKPKHFWACVVWDKASVKIWEITQRSIQDAIAALAEDPQWGHPRGYQLTINRAGKGLTTEYSVVPSPPSALPAEAIAAWKSRDIDLDELYMSGDPFAPAVERLGAAGSYSESRALRLLEDGLRRSENPGQIQQWAEWADKGKQLDCISRYAGDVGRAKSLVAAMVGDRLAELSVPVVDEADIPF